MAKQFILNSAGKMVEKSVYESALLKSQRDSKANVKEASTTDENVPRKKAKKV
jgi:hypothetical protein